MKRKEGIKKVIEKGKFEGIKERNYSIAKSLKQMDMDNKSISKATGLTIEEIGNLPLIRIKTLNIYINK